MIVADASAVLEWLLGGARGHAAESALKGKDVHAPAHLDIEIGHVTRRLASRSVITPARGKAMVQILGETPIRRIPLSPLLPRIWTLRGSLAAYDAAYVALAEALSAPLLTFDRKIRDDSAKGVAMGRARGVISGTESRGRPPTTQPTKDEPQTT